ncbi:hypothetical protein Pmani_020879 [Petrolisthes manimaculis]|uniref:THAP-type domain-containing protein n=1 Tax=Petrolisthes manimaculis TaxID=1843537 RepID=A0AAE1PHI0_9EUCA|nr:hypothetical protein Pmani_020879 [Petrolisthes manimaculis]
MVWCSVFGCSGKNPDGGFYPKYRFPKERNIKLAWINRCGRRDKVSQHGRVCAKHFSQEQYARDFKSELLNIPSPRNQRRLKCEAIPDLHLPCKQDASKVANDRAQRYTKRSGKRILAEICSNGSADSPMDITTHGTSIQSNNRSTSIPEQATSALQMIDDGIGISDDFSVSAVTSTQMDCTSPGDKTYATLVSVQPNTHLVDDDNCMATGLSEFVTNSSPIKGNSSSSQRIAQDQTIHDPCLSAQLCTNLDVSSETNEEMGNIPVPENEVEGFHYVLGYIVHKFHKTYPALVCEHKLNGDWIAVKDNGGLKRMAPTFIEKFEIAEKMFRKVHGDTLVEDGPGLEELTNITSNIIPEVPFEVVKFYMWCRLQIRLKAINRRGKIKNMRNKYKKMSKVVA